MRIEKIILTNYIGPYNGMGRNEIEIDMTNFRKRKVLIMGQNGLGKSEILHSLTPFPDETSRLIPCLEAEKYLKISHNGCFWDIKIVYPVDGSGNRTGTKAYINRMGEPLNPNGNIGSYKDCIYREFGLDPAYMVLTELTAVKRGLADMKPAERKKLLVSIMSGLDIYNDINKNMSKRLSVYKSMISNLSNKINILGDPDKLTNAVVLISEQISGLKKQQIGISESMGACKADIERMDPNGSIQNKYNELVEAVKRVNIELGNIEDKLNGMKDTISSLGFDATQDLTEVLVEASTKNKMLIEKLEEEIKKLTEQEAELNKELREKTAKLDALMINSESSKLKKEISSIESKLIEYKGMFTDINIDNISRDELVSIIDSLTIIEDSIKSMFSYYDLSEINLLKENMNNPSVLLSKMEAIQANIDSVKYKINQSSKQLEFPSFEIKCKDNDCELYKWWKNSMELKQTDLNYLTDELKSLEAQLEAHSNSYHLLIEINNFIRSTNSYKLLFSKVDCLSSLVNINIDTVFKIVSKEIPILPIIDNIKAYINKINIVEVYEKLSNQRVMLLEQLEKSNNIDIEIAKIQTDIDNNVINKLHEVQNNMQNKSMELENLSSQLEKLMRAKELYLQYKWEVSKFDKVKDEKLNLSNQYNLIKSNIKSIEEQKQRIEELRAQYNGIAHQIEPLNRDRDKYNQNLQLIGEYTQELATINDMYNKVDTIKYFTASSTGVQTTLMEMYMNGTRDMTNELLRNMFDAKFMIPEFIINDSEFRIPCYGNTIPNYDISSLSSAQVSMVSMILSFVLLKKSSSSYNILRLDEVDAPLDKINRLYFSQTTDNLIDILGVEQLFMISHNHSELTTDNCDIINLNDYILNM